MVAGPTHPHPNPPPSRGREKKGRFRKNLPQKAVPHAGPIVTETRGSPTFPRSPCEDLPRSQTPVVSCARAIAHPGLRPSGACTPSACLSGTPERSPRVHDSTPFGAQSRGLSPHYSQLRTASYGGARGCAPDRLARHSSGRKRAGTHRGLPYAVGHV